MAACMLVALLFMVFSLPSTSSTLVANITVATDGSGNYRTVSDAVKAAPIHSKDPFVIHIKKGVYVENVEVPKQKTNLVFIGDGADYTKITGKRSRAKGFKTHDTATVAAKGDGFVAKFITFENSAKPSEGMAVAFMNEANMSAIYQCNFLGYQDTLYARKGWQFYRECDVYGRVDFICGSAFAVFQNSNLYARILNESYEIITFTAQSRNKTVTNPLKSGYVIQNCSLTKEPGVDPKNVEVKAYLGRPWSIYSTVMVMESWLDTLIDPKGWTEMKKNEPLDKLTYREYNNRGSGSNTSGRVSWPGYKVINHALDAKPFTVTEFINGDQWLPHTGVPYYGGFTTQSLE